MISIAATTHMTKKVSINFASTSNTKIAEPTNVPVANKAIKIVLKELFL